MVKGFEDGVYSTGLFGKIEAAVNDTGHLEGFISVTGLLEGFILVCHWREQ